MRRSNALLDFLDISHLGRVIDPWSGLGTVAQGFARHGIRVHTNDVEPARAADTHMDALQPGFYRMSRARVGLDAVVTSPWFATLDLALPLAVLAARTAACIHVPGHYITDAHPARATYLMRLIGEGRLHMLCNLPKGAMGRRCVWIIIFASSALKDVLVRPTRRLAAPVSFASPATK